jgi:hypothetical protein
MEAVMAWIKDIAAGLTFVIFVGSSFVLTTATHAVFAG